MIKITPRKLYQNRNPDEPRNAVVSYSKYPFHECDDEMCPHMHGSHPPNYYSKRITIDFLFFDIKIQWRAK